MRRTTERPPVAILNTEESDDGVVVVRWDDGENRFNLDSVGEWHQLLDDLVGRRGPLALVVTGTGKFFSNGLDLDRFEGDPDEAAPHPRWSPQALRSIAVVPGVDHLRHQRALFRRRRHDVMHRRTAPDAHRAWLLVPARGRPGPSAHSGDDGHRHRQTARRRCRRTRCSPACATRRRCRGGAADWSMPRVPEDDLLERAIAEARTAMAGKDRSVIGNHKRQLFGEAADLWGDAMTTDSADRSTDPRRRSPTPSTMADGGARPRRRFPSELIHRTCWSIVLDDLGFAHLGCFGSDLDTPNLDRLAERGVRSSPTSTPPPCVRRRGRAC